MPRQIVCNLQLRRILLTALTLLACTWVIAQRSTAELLSLADLKVEAGDLSNAAVLIDLALEQDSTDIDVWLYRANLEKTLESDLSPLDYYYRALALDSTHASTLNDLGLFLSHRGYVPESLPYFEKAIAYSASDSAHATYLNNRGVAYKNANDLPGAILNFEDVLEIDSLHQGALNNLATSYAELGNSEKALEVLMQIYPIALNDRMRMISAINIGMTHAEIGRPDSALIWYQKAAVINPENAILLSNQAESYRQLGMFQEALAHIEASIARYPENSWAYYNLAKIYFDQDLLEEGCKALSFSRGYGFGRAYGDRVEQLAKEMECSE